MPNEIINFAKKLRRSFPERYGIKGRKPGEIGYVYNGWKNAINTASVIIKNKENEKNRRIDYPDRF